VTLKGVDRLLGISAAALHARLQAPGLAELVAEASPEAARLLIDCLEPSRVRRESPQRQASGGLRGSWAEGLRATHQGTPPPEDYCGLGYEPTEVAGRDAPPGSDARVELHARRYARRERLFSARDWRPDMGDRKDESGPPVGYKVIPCRSDDGFDRPATPGRAGSALLVALVRAGRRARQRPGHQAPHRAES
jgi:hypothetical protein